MSDGDFNDDELNGGDGAGETPEDTDGETGEDTEEDTGEGM